VLKKEKKKKLLASLKSVQCRKIFLSSWDQLKHHDEDYIWGIKKYNCIRRLWLLYMSLSYQSFSSHIL